MTVTAALIALVALPAAAGAVVPGPNGQIAFASGRADGATSFGDLNAQIWRIAPSGGTATRVTSLNDLKQHRHPAWSPDRRFLAYARCAADNCGFTGPWDIIIRDMVLGSSVDITATLANPGTSDRPYFSPDGTRIAYARKPNPPNTDFNIYTQPVNNGSGGAETPIVATTDNEERPTWSADGQTIFYQRLVAANDRDVYKVASGGGTGTGVITGGNDDYQVATSPDGQSICYVDGLLGSNDAEVKRATIAGANTQPVSEDDNVGSYNCVWSPDGTKIAYANGIFGNAVLVMRNSDGTGAVTTITDCPGTMCFDGNPDWAVNGSPTCQGTTSSVAFNAFLSINLSCADTGPDFEQTGVSESIVTNPTHGNLGSVQQGNPAKVIYTPNLNFQGTDSFTFKGNDGTSDSGPATVSITVNGPGGGGGGGGADTVPATISSVLVSPSRWRLGSLLPRYSLAPKGTTIRFRLSEDAVVTLTFAKATSGRRVGGICRRTTRANRKRPRCTRYVTKGSLRRTLKAGLRRVRFQGRLTARKRLTLGRYRLRIGAVDMAGNKSKTRTAFFTIVRR